MFHQGSRVGIVPLHLAAVLRPPRVLLQPIPHSLEIFVVAVGHAAPLLHARDVEFQKDLTTN